MTDNISPENNNNAFQGKTIEGYKILKPLGQGKFSTVYKAEVVKDNKIVALKKIKIFDMMDPKQREKCLKEVQLMQPLSHPNIIKYLDSFIYNNELIIVTEWAERGDLKKLIKTAIVDQTPFDELRIWDYILQISSGLDHMSEKRIMHRDLKPANIFISANGALKIGDLGLGRVFSSQTVEAYSKVGTPLYMSPELLRGEGYDMKSDIWSLGCIAYEMAELKSPFRNDGEKLSLMELFGKITKGSFNQISDKYSPQLNQTISSMIVVDPAFRVDSRLVMEQAQGMITQLQRKSPKIDSNLVMEDIYEKLNLINYRKGFCQKYNKKAIDKYYFAQRKESSGEQQQQLVDIGYWIINRARKTYKEVKITQHNQKKVLDSFINDIIKFGVVLDNNFDMKQIEQGYGDTVCFVLNDIVNRELVRLNFKFQSPNIKGMQTINNKQQEQEQNQEEDDQDEQSVQEESDQLMDSQQSFYTNRNENYSEDEWDQENRMIFGNYSAEEWEQEITNVNDQLGDNQYESQAQFDRVEQFINISDNIDVIKQVLQMNIDKWDQQIEYLKTNEKRIQFIFQDHQQTLMENSQVQLELNSKLNNKMLTFDKKIKDYDSLTQQYQQKSLLVNDENEHDENYKLQQIQIKKAQLMEEIKKMGVREMILNTLINNKIKDNNKENQIEKEDEIDKQFQSLHKDSLELL